MTACSMPKHVAVSSALADETAVLYSTEQFFVKTDERHDGANNFEEVSNCCLSIAGCERPEN